MRKLSIFILVLFLLLLSIAKGYRVYEKQNYLKERELLTLKYEQAVQGNEQASDKKVLGKITIPSLNIDYIILDEVSDENLDISISKVTGPDIHQPGNLVLAGHNMKNGSFFGKLNKANASTIIYLQNNSNITQKYKVEKMYTVKDTDLKPLEQNNTSDKLLTLITCTSNSTERLIVVAEQVKK